METIAKQVVMLRNLRGWGIEEFAEIVGLDVDTVRGLEQGTIDPQLSVLQRITNALNCSFKIGDVSI